MPFFPPLISLIRKKAGGLESAATIRTKVFVWGLNDKDQLGGLKGSKVPSLQAAAPACVSSLHGTEEQFPGAFVCQGLSCSQNTLKVLINSWGFQIVYGKMEFQQFIFVQKYYNPCIILSP